MAFRIGFLGSPEFAAVSLKKLLETGAIVAGVVTAPDRPKGRSLKSQPTPVSILAQQAGLPVLTPPDVNVPEVVQTLRSWHVNIIIVVAFGQILKEPLLDLPPLGCINLHPSLLPLYRGAAPIQRALMEGRTQTGVTVARMVRKLDAGDILAQQREVIRPGDTFGLLHHSLADTGAELLVEVLKALASGTHKAVAQDEAEATYALKLKREEEFIRWENPASQIRNLVRALNPAPGAASVLLYNTAREEVKIWSVREDEAVSRKAVAGTILEVGKTGMRVMTGRGSLWIQEIQSASRAKMPIAQWLLGHPVRMGDGFQ